MRCSERTKRKEGDRIGSQQKSPVCQDSEQPCNPLPNT